MIYVGLFCLGFFVGFICSVGGCLVLIKERDKEVEKYLDEKWCESVENDKEVKPWL